MRPHGIFGQVAGFIMANRRSNIIRNEWTLELLALKPTDYLLEIGFGPGIAIQKASQIVTDGLVVGIDHSETMMAQATKRNAVTIQCGRVNLYLAAVEDLPAFSRPLEKIYSANVVQFWRDPVTIFKNLRSLLVPGGLIANTYMPRHSGATDKDSYKKAKEVMTQLKVAGFSSIRVKEKRMKPVSAVSVLAVNEV